MSTSYSEFLREAMLNERSGLQRSREAARRSRYSTAPHGAAHEHHSGHGGHAAAAAAAGSVSPNYCHSCACAGLPPDHGHVHYFRGHPFCCYGHPLCCSRDLGYSPGPAAGSSSWGH
eukprot:tig00001029_g6428.t1